ncbi:MAG: hypothetical protein IMW97_05175 [Firmicutes bacterium]|nr:hypothetical protein [Candidatus Fermentithermobacillaceae bacterium]
MSDSGNPTLRSERGILTELQVDERYPTFGSATPPVALPVAPGFVNLVSVTLTVDDSTDRVWVNGTVGWYATFSAVGVAEATFQILRDGTVVYETRQSVNSATAVPTTVNVHNVAHCEHVDTTPVAYPTRVTYTLRAQASVANVFTAGPVTLSAAEIERNPVG